MHIRGLIHDGLQPLWYLILSLQLPVLVQVLHHVFHKPLVLHVFKLFICFLLILLILILVVIYLVELNELLLFWAHLLELLLQLLLHLELHLLVHTHLLYFIYEFLGVNDFFLDIRATHVCAMDPGILLAPVFLLLLRWLEVLHLCICLFLHILHEKWAFLAIKSSEIILAISVEATGVLGHTLATWLVQFTVSASWGWHTVIVTAIFNHFLWVLRVKGLGLFWGLKHMHEHYLHVLVRLHRVHAIHLLVKLLKKLYGDLLVIFYNVYPPIYNFGTLVL